MLEPSGDPQSLKQTIRRDVLATRRRQHSKDEFSRIICGKLAALDEYHRAGVVMSYVDVRSEVRTRPFLPEILRRGKTLVVPYCVGPDLGLFRLENMDELAPGYFGLLEPLPDLRLRADKRIDPAQLDLVMVPGVAFDPHGGRIGHGKGYYDRLLPSLRPDACLVGLAFQCQIVPEVPMQPYDVAMDLVITEIAIRRGRGRSGPRPPASH